MRTPSALPPAADQRAGGPHVARRAAALVRLWKQPASRGPLRAVPINGEHGRPIGRLMPIDTERAGDPIVADLLTRWRRQFSDCFFSQFTPTRERTLRWLESYAADDSRLLFLILDADGRPLGNVGLSNLEDRSAELDNLIRAEPSATPRMGLWAVQSLIDWLLAELPQAALTLRVFSDNQRAISLYEQLGFEAAGIQPLVSETAGGEVRYRAATEAESSRASRHWLRMQRIQKVAESATGMSRQQPARTTEVAGMERIPVSGPSITQKEIDYVADAVANCWYGEANRYHDQFEQAFADYLGVKHAVALPSCTSAIHLALSALDVGRDDEVVVPDITWIASAAPISYLGATPVFADVDPQTWCLSPESLEAVITPRTKAVIPVDLYGSMPQMDVIRAIARRRGLAVIEDAAEAIGSQFGGHKAGSLGDVGVFSFHGSKTMTTGEGGMLVTNREDVYRRVLVLRDHGRQPGDKTFWNSEVGFKYKMSSMQAALGLAQLERIDELVLRKRQIFAWYRQALDGCRHLTLNHEPPDVKNSYWMVTAIVDPQLGLAKEQLIGQMAAEGIDCRPFFYPLSSLPPYVTTPQGRRAQKQNHVSYALSPYGINLPSGMRVTPAIVARVAAALTRIVADHIHALGPKRQAA